jgi:large subunit ribosomal protein L10
MLYLQSLIVRVGEAGAKFCVAKNSLVKIAAKETAYKGLDDYFKGPTALVFSKDPIAGIKAIKKYADDNEKLKVIKASLNDKIIDEDEFIKLSKLPSLDEVRAEITGYLVAPHQQLVRVLNATASDIIGTLDNFSKKNN